MIFKRLMLKILSLAIVVNSTDLSIEEKIKLHKEWLEKNIVRKPLRKIAYDKLFLQNSHNYVTNKLKSETKNINKDNFLRKSKLLLKEDHSKNDVYPQIEKNGIVTVSENFSVILPSTTTITTKIAPQIYNTSTTFIHQPTTVDYTTLIPFSSTTEYVTNLSNSTKEQDNNFYWSTWSNWSECSRSCGGGIMYQTRKCLSRENSNIISNDCIGVYKRYHLCNKQKCPVQDNDFRYQQCSNFNNVLFQGKKYQWEPYIKDDAECELNCKPIGMKYFATLNKTVIDGTSCTHPAEYYRKNYRGSAICVDGICKAIHANGAIAGSFINNNIINCGNLVCREISGVFTKDLVTEGYVHVVTIEAGASNISITEVQHSQNLLALRVPSENKYVFNGDYTISPDGVYEAGGAIFDYRRIDSFVSDGTQSKTSESITEWITSAGPLLQPVELLVLGLGYNPGIKYEYLLPIGSYADLEESVPDSASVPENENESKESEIKPNLRSINRYEKSLNVSNKNKNGKFAWKVVGFSLCSKSCGGGIRNPIIRCVRKASNKYYNKRRCSHSKKPVINESTLQCNTQPCPPYWRIESWTECFCYDGEGFKKRDVNCVQELTMDIAIQVNDSACMEEKPVSKKKCNCSKFPRQLSSPSKVQAYAKAPNILIGNNTYHRRIAHSHSNFGTWLMSDWNQQCSTDCGYGIEYRSIFCDRLPLSNQICDVSLTPDFSRSCENKINCDKAEWFVGSWKNCSGDCFNITKSRSVFCIRNHLIVDSNECIANEKPESVQKCSIDEVEYCKAKWHYSLWSQCSKTCGGGTQKRIAKCLKYDLLQNTLKESTECLYSMREPIYRQCNPHQCHN